jgi:hypothetical protein
MIRRDLVLALRRATSQLSLGARRRCRLALSSRRRTKEVDFSVPASQTRRMNVLQVAYFSSGVLA